MTAESAFIWCVGMVLGWCIHACWCHLRAIGRMLITGKSETPKPPHHDHQDPR